MSNKFFLLSEPYYSCAFLNIYIYIYMIYVLCLKARRNTQKKTMTNCPYEKKRKRHKERVRQERVLQVLGSLNSHREQACGHRCAFRADRSTCVVELLRADRHTPRRGHLRQRAVTAVHLWLSTHGAPKHNNGQ